MDNELVRKVVNDSIKMYALPQTLSEVLRIVKDENSSAEHLAKVLSKDPALVTKILRIVNSPFYGLGRPVGSVTQAVVTLGMRQVTALALSTSIYSLTDKWQSCLDRVRFWRHSLEVAIASRDIAQKAGYRNLEEMFVAGLLHDMGMLMLEHSFPKEYAGVWKQSQRQGCLFELEELTWGTNHARVGQFLLEQWHIPAVICESVGRHHNVFPPGARDEDLIPGQIVNLANLISQFPIGTITPANRTPDTENRRILRENLGLSAETLLSVEKHLFNQTIQESQYVEIDVGSTEDILVEANRLLFDQYAAVENLLDENRRMQQQAAGDQVKRGFLESFKSATSVLTTFSVQAADGILRRAEEVLESIETGSIVDPKGMVASAANDIIRSARSMNSVMEQMHELTQTESAMYYDQQSVTAVEDRIQKELELLAEPAEMA
jgi:HD-like signal output (HDOD) protein